MSLQDNKYVWACEKKSSVLVTSPDNNYPAWSQGTDPVLVLTACFRVMGDE